jgi:hypothetical protein
MMRARHVMSELSSLLEAALVRELRRVYERQNQRLFREQLKPPVLVLSDSTKRLGQWISKTRTLELSRSLVLQRPWLEVTSVLEHEMAHQFVEEVLKITGGPPHGPTFARVCAERGIDAKAAGTPVPAAGGDDPQDDRVLGRIRKLLALAGSENQHEAELAMKKAHALMLRHNLDQVPHGPSQTLRYVVRHLGKPHRRSTPVELEIMGIISEYFFVEVIRVPVYQVHTGTHASTFEVMGTRENVEMAEHVHAFLLATCDRLWRENRADRRVKSGRDRLAYQSGVIRGFRDKLVAERTELAQTEGLVWVGDSELETFFRSRYPRITRRRRLVRYSGAHAAGREAGRTVVLHKPVTGGETSSRRLLLR